MWAILLTAAGLFTSLAALLFLHHTLTPIAPLVCLAAGLGSTLLLRTIWSDLPGFVTRWLDAGTLVATVLLAASSTLFSRSIPYMILVWPRAAGLLLAAGFLGLAVAGLASTHRRLEQVVRHQTRQIGDARRAAAESRLTALSAQVNPHFLFNTLNTLAEVVHEDEDRAEDLIADLASMMRYSLDNSARRVTLEEEFDVVRRLLRIEEARLGDRLTSTLTLEPAVAEARIPGFLVQPLVENAVRHGVAPRVEGGRIEVSAVATAAGLCITVLDDGSGLDALPQPSGDDEHSGGVANVLERLRLAWPADTADLVLVPGPGTRLELHLPLEVS